MKEFIQNLGKVRPTVAQNYSSLNEYDILTFTSVNNSIYISIKDVPKNIDINNTEYWECLITPDSSQSYDETITNLANSIERVLVNVNKLSKDLNDHKLDSNIHVTEEEKNKWNKSYILQIATELNLGGIRAANKTYDYTEEVKIDPTTGKLYTRPSEQGITSIPQASDNVLGGIKASQKTAEYTTEVKIDGQTGKLYVPPTEAPTSDIIPDEEDLTKVIEGEYNFVKFKNRTSDKGLGYVILRTNKSLLEQINVSDTIYEVRYDFDLNGETLEIPEGCILKFNGGSFENGTIEGNNTQLDGYPTYSIFNDCDVLGFNIGCFDVRWFGGKPDYDSTTKTGTDNAVAFDRVIKTCGKHMGAYVKVVGKYVISSTIEVKYDLNLVGDYHVGRSFWTPDYPGYADVDIVEESCSSLIYVPENIIAFKVTGRGLDVRKTSNININNIRLVGGSMDNSIFMEFTATGAPPRVGKFAECLCVGFNKVLYFHDLGEFSNGTIYGNLTIEKIIAYSNNQFIVAKATADLIPTLCNLKITDSNIEGNGDNAIYLENLFGPNVIENCLLENSPNVINATIINGSLDIRNNYFERQYGEYMLKVKGKSSYNCFVTCVNSYRVRNDIGLPYIIEGVTIVDFNTCNQSVNDVKFNNCKIDKNLYHKLNTNSFTNTLMCSDLNFYKPITENDTAYLFYTGSNTIERGLRGVKDFTGNARIARSACSVVEGDEIILCYYQNGIEHEITLTDDEGTLIVPYSMVAGSAAPGIIFLKFQISNVSSHVNVRFNATNAINVSNGFIFKNVDNTMLFNLGIALPDYLPTSISIENQSTESIKGLAVVSENTYDGMFYSDGTNIRNSDGSLFEKTVIVSKFVDYHTFQIPNKIWKVVGDVDMGGVERQVSANCILDFTAGGTIKNGSLRLNKTKIFPYGINLSETGGAIVQNVSHSEGQVVYDSSLKKQKLWNGDGWVNLDGTEIS